VRFSPVTAGTKLMRVREKRTRKYFHKESAPTIAHAECNVKIFLSVLHIGKSCNYMIFG